MVSAIIPTYNAEQYIDDLLKALSEQTTRPEIVVVDSSSSDRTVEIAESYGAKVLSIRKEEFNHGGTRNLGADTASGDIVVFLTQDAVPADTHCVEYLTKVLENDEIAASYGRQVPRQEAMPTEKFARHFNYPDKPLLKSWNSIPDLGIKTFFFSNVFSAVRRAEFKKMGGFPEKLIMFEDMLFAASLLRNGYKIAYVPDARVIHSHNYNWLQQFKRYEMAGISFSGNPWFLQYARGQSEGVAFLKEELRTLIRGGMYRWCLYALVEAMFKYAGYRLGLRYESLPKTLKARILRSVND